MKNLEIKICLNNKKCYSERENSQEKFYEEYSDEENLYNTNIKREEYEINFINNEVIFKEEENKNEGESSIKYIFYLKRLLSQFSYEKTLIQKDTYFSCEDGRLKLREEDGEIPYMIYYKRPNNNVKFSVYHTYYINDINSFRNTITPNLNEELVIKKTRVLYMYENARIHLDHVENLGYFFEVEVVINNEEEEREAKNVLDHILNVCELKEKSNINHQNTEIITCGYRELLIEKMRDNKDLNYYLKSDKIFWIINEDILLKDLIANTEGSYCIPESNYIKKNAKIPCIFVERSRDKNTGENIYKILQLDLSISNDNRKYTMWRRIVGEKYGIYVDVLLIYNNKLYKLDGYENNKKLEFSDIIVNRKYLAVFE